MSMTRAEVLSAGLALLVFGVLIWVFAERPATVAGNYAEVEGERKCWLPVSVPAQDVALKGKPGQVVNLSFAASDRVSLLIPADGSIPSPNTEISGEVALAEAAGSLVVRGGESLLMAGGGEYSLGPRHFIGVYPPVALQPAGGLRLALTEALAVGNDRKVPAFRADIVLDGRSPDQAGVIEASLLSPTSLPPYANSFDPSDPATFHLVRADLMPTTEHPGTVRVRARNPDVDFAAAELRACVRTASGAFPAPIMSIAKAGPGAADLFVSIPNEVAVPVFSWAQVGLVTADGRFAGRDDFLIMGFFPALLFSGAILMVSHALTSRLLRRGDAATGWLGWFVGVDDRASLSLFQIYLWTWVVFGGFAYVFALTGELFAVTKEVLYLLGIAGLGSVGARYASLYQGRPITKAPDTSFADVFMTHGQFDLYKLQMFLFTVATAAYVVYRILVDQAFPVLDENLLLLLGISNGLYVGSKLGTETPAQVIIRVDVEKEALNERRADIEAEGLPSSAEALVPAVANLEAEVEALRAQLDTAGDDRAAREAELENKVGELENKKNELMRRQSIDEIDRKIEQLEKERAAAVNAL